VEGGAHKFVVVILAVVLLANTPCLVACVLHPCPAQPQCHHKSEAKQPCPHQMLRATAPAAPVAVFMPMPAEAPGVEAPVLPGSIAALSPAWDSGLPPPLSARTQTLILQV